MGNISTHISRHEIECHCGCGMSSADKRLVEAIEDCVQFFEDREARRLKVFFITWNLCQAHNAAKGGAELSRHPMGLATVFSIEDVKESDVADYLEARWPASYGIGRYDGRTYLDVRDYPARWDRRSI